jgi:hypothetical protein
MVAKRVARWARPDIRRVEAELEVTDEALRGDAVRALCPCHAGWDLFEQHVGDVFRALRDPSRVVRRHALHVFEDAARMQSAGDLQYSIEPGEEKIREKRGRYFRSMEERLQARRDRKIRKQQRRH